MQGRPRARIECLDALRGLCALCVALFHFETTGMLTQTAFLRHSWMLVDFFFVLSGFVITAAYGDALSKGVSIGQFLFLRLARIWPLHGVMLACFLGLELSKLVLQIGPDTPLFAPPRELGSLAMNLLLLQVFGIYDHLTWNIPSWSIAAEFWVYVLAAVAFRFIPSRTGLFIAIAAVCAIAMILRGPPFLNLAHDGGVVRCLYGFSIGSLTWSAFTRASPLVGAWGGGSKWATVGELLVIAVVILGVSLSRGGPETVAMPLIFGVCVLVLAQQRGQVSALLGWRFPVWLGTISYSIYMTHLFVEGRLFDLLTIAGRMLDVPMVERVVADGVAKRVLVGGELFINLTILALILLIMAIAWASYRFVEQPCNQWARARISRHRRTLVMGAAS